MRQAALLVALACVLTAPVVGAAAVTGTPSQATVQQDNATLPEEGVEVTVQIRGDGAARWNISTKYALEDQNDTAAFERLRQQFEAYQTNDEFSVDVFRAVVPQVSERVDRSMEIREAGRTSRVVDHGNNSTGVLTVQFTWTNFSRVTNETLVVDSFSGSWFGDLKRGQTLTVRPPEGYDTDQVQPGPSTIRGGAYVWNGPQEFGPGEPTVVFTEASAPPPTTGPSGVSVEVLVGAVLFTLLLVAVFVLAAYRGTPEWVPSDVSAVRSWLVDEENETTTEDGSESAETKTKPETGPSPGGPAGEASAGATDSELLSDEERVEALLREHGGRMKQSKIVEETRWSTAKVSQLLSSMAEDGRVEKLRIGRENLISLPDEGVEEE
ncbi:MAG: hypothetical protein ABEH83_07445 [Halobacterium sp.]